MLRLATASPCALLALLLLLAPSCKRCGVDGVGAPRAEPKGPPVPLGPAKLAVPTRTAGARRILLDDGTLARVRASARAKSRAWLAVSARCEEAAQKNLPSGYQGFEWAGATASLALCWNATGDARYAGAGVRYLAALLDDRFEIGDGQGGATVVTHDSGYGTRTFAAYSALGYDWLRGAPGMDAALGQRVADRLDAWLSWYAKDGYLNDEPFSNYYWGYLTALSFAGLAYAGDSARGTAWLERARDQLSVDVLPAFRDRLVGGGWPEGWQYGEYTTLEIALTARALHSGAGIDVPARMPWLGQVVTHHAHALLPDGTSVYDGGTWGEHPAKPSGLGLSAVAFALEGVDDARASEARFLATQVLPALPREHAWVGLLIDAPSLPQRDPRKGAPLSLHLSGQGLSFFRSDWSKSAVWASFQAGPFLTPDHQDKDQGHFELWRGGDGLLVDGGDSEGSATINHNTLLVDDGGRNLNYSPNQGVWGRKVRTTRFADDGRVAVAVGEIGSAYNPKCVEEGCRRRSVDELTRTFVYVRPALLVVDDRVVLDRAGDGVTWAAHTTVKPKLSGNLASAVVGSSRVDVRMLEPGDATSSAPKEPNGSGDGPHRTNHPWGPMWRLQFESPRTSTERGFLAFITTDRRDGSAPDSQPVAGDHLRGALGASSGTRIAVLFSDGAREGRIDLPKPASLVVLLGLEPGQRYGVTTTTAADCSLSLSFVTDESGESATAGGFLRLSAPACEVR